MRKLFSGHALSNAMAKRCLSLLLAAALAIPIGSIAFGAGPPERASLIPEITIPVLDVGQAPVIDGFINEDEWDMAGRIVSLNSPDGVPQSGGIFLDPRDVTVWLTADEEYVYVAVKSEMPPAGGLLTSLKPYDISDTQVFADDNVEIWLDPWNGAGETEKTRDMRAFQMAVNEDGAYFTASHGSNGTYDAMWRPGWTFKTTQDDEWWYVELAIPLANLGITTANFNYSWGIHTGRGFKQPFAYTNFAPRMGGYADLGTMAVVNWGEKNTPFARALRIRDESNNATPDVAFELVNPTAEPYTFNVYINSNYKGDAFRGINGANFVVPAGERQVVSVADGWTEGDYRTSVYITSQDESVVYYYRVMDWQVQRTADRWDLVDRPAGKPFDFQFGYYPSYNTFKAQIDLKKLKLVAGTDEVTGAWVKIADQATGVVVANETFPAFIDNVSDIEINLSDATKDLQVGYENRRVFSVESGLVGAGPGVPTETVKSEFVRQKFEWEGNAIGLGLDDLGNEKVYAPFTPLTVSGMDVGAVLRTHTMNNVGLWDQVTSEGVDILAAPMRFEVEIDGVAQTISASWPDITKIGDARVNHTANWSAGELSAELKGSMEMDGFTKIDMKLTQTGSGVINKLDLVIPLNDDLATLMHTVADYTRLNYSGEIPQGIGKIWDSKDAGKIGLSPGFLPYIWIGNEKYGLCWVAENDKDWIVDDAKASLELVRDGSGNLNLIVHFVNKPLPLGRERNITFAIQATPTKPFPEYTDFNSDDPNAKTDWRNLIIGTRSIEGKYDVPVIGSTLGWGSETTFCDVYPTDYNYDVFDIMAELRKYGFLSDPDKLTEWRQIYETGGESAKYGYYGGARPEEVAWYNTNVNWFVNALSYKPEGLVAYTSPRSSRENEEFRTFQDEWRRFGLTERPLADIWYDCSPVESYRDYSLYYLN